MLDKKFGVAYSPRSGRGNPNGWFECEKKFKPNTLGTLDDNQKILRELIAADMNDPMMRALLSQTTILWAVDDSGQIFTAFEELSPDDEHVTANAGTVIYQRNITFGKRPEKLGHPSLVECGKARICGEVAFGRLDSGLDGWVINENSGRYSYDRSRTREQLDNVAQEFRKRNINLKVEYYGR